MITFILGRCLGLQKVVEDVQSPPFSLQRIILSYKLVKPREKNISIIPYFVLQIFKGNFDAKTVVTNFVYGIHAARFIRFHPATKQPMRVEVYGRPSGKL